MMAGSLKLRAQSLYGALIKRSYGFKSSLAIALLLAMAATYGFFTPIDGFLYDAFVRTMPAASKLKRQVALIDVPVEKFSSNDTDWEAMVSRAMDLGARQIVFTIAPTFDTTRLGHLLQRKDVIIGGAITPDPDNELDSRFISAPRIGTLTFPAVAAVPDPLLGVHRYQRFSYQVNRQAIPSLEVLTAQRLGVPTSSDGRFMVNFSGQQHHFPRMSLAQALEGGLIRDVVQDRVIVLGPALDRLHRSVVTPITKGNRQVSELEYHAFALDSLLNNTAVASLWPAAKGLLILAMWLVCFLILQPMSFRRGMLAIATISLGISAKVVRFIVSCVKQVGLKRKRVI